MSLPHRPGSEGRASEAQMARGRRFLTRRDRWAPHTTAQAWADFEATEAAEEARRDRRN